MPRIDLPRGFWVDMKDPTTLRQKDRKDVIRAIEAEKHGDASAALAGVDAVIAVLVENWSVEEDGKQFPLPRNVPSILDTLPVDVYDALAAAAEPAMEHLAPKTAEPDPTSPGSSPQPATGDV